MRTIIHYEVSAQWSEMLGWRGMRAAYSALPQLRSRSATSRSTLAPLGIALN